jgi:large subunit ribosomal protein L10
MARPNKEAAVAELTAKLKESYGAIVTDYRGLPVKAMSDLRRQLRAAGAECKVVKNTLMRRAAEEVGIAEMSEILNGPTAVVFTGEDPAPPTKAILTFARQAGLPQIRAAIIGGKLYAAERVQELATLPSRDIMLARAIGAIQGPVAALAMTLQGIVGQLPATLQALAHKRESTGA